MSFFLAALVVVVFAVLLGRLRLVGRARSAAQHTGDCLRVLRDRSLDDRAKERALQSHAVRLFGLFALLVGGGAVALAAPLLGVWMLDRAGVASFGGVLATLERADFLAATALVGLAAWLVIRRVGRADRR